MANKKIKKNAVVLTARDLLNGYTAEKYDQNLYNMTPLQMLPEAEKDDEWKKWNLDWLERVGIRQVAVEAPKMIKNYHLANGVLDKNDYIIGEGNDMSGVVSAIVGETENKIPLKYYPVIPNVVNVLIGEFTKRDNRIIAIATDEFSQSEDEDAKMEQLKSLLTQKMEQDKLVSLMNMGVDTGSDKPEVQQMIQQELDLAKQMAELQTKFKNYRSIPEQWANHKILEDNDRFNMYQLETIGFRDMLVTDREFWHVKLLEDDYVLELWNPINVFYHKSPDKQYVSDGNYVGRILLMSVADVIDLYGDKMTEEQVLELKEGYRVATNLPLVDNAYAGRLDMYTNYSKPYPNSINNVTWGKHMDGQFAKVLNGQAPTNNDFNFAWYDINRAPVDYLSALDSPGMVRVTEGYWKTQRKIGELTVINEGGEKDVKTVDENFKVTVLPIYDKSITKDDCADNLIYGEHVEWTWINEVRWGIKINSAISTFYSRSYTGFEPIYIGGDPLPFQFKGQDILYGARLPVEGFVSSERNSYSSSLVDKMKSYQIMFNVLNNQIMEMLADDIGNVIIIDQNMIPRNSLGGEWGKNNFPMFYQIMKDYQIAAVDTSMQSMGAGVNFNNMQQVNMSKTEQIITRLKLADWAKQQAFEVVGITPQRLGSVAASESATGVRQAVNNSYAQTEPYFDAHMNHLMPRVRQMMLDAAQFITSTKPNSRVRYLNRDDENEFFNIEGHRLLLRDFRIFAKSTANVKEMLEQLRKLAVENNTSGGSLYELSQMMVAQSPAEIISKLRAADEKRQEDVQAQRDHETQMQQMQQEAMDKENQRQDYWRGKELEKDILVAEIRASQSKTNDVNHDGMPDPLQALDLMEKQKMNAETILNLKDKSQLDRQKHEDGTQLERDKMQLEREKMGSQERIEAMKLKNPVVGEKKR